MLLCALALHHYHCALTLSPCPPSFPHCSPSFPHCSHSLTHALSLSLFAASQVLQLAFRIYMGQKRLHDAMRVALRLNEQALIEESFGEQLGDRVEGV